MEYETIKEKAARVRKALKEQYGYTSRDVSVKSSYCGYSTALDLTIKRPDISIMNVQRIANKAESIRYDERCNEILSGGNTFVNVVYDSDMIDHEAQKYMHIANNVHMDEEHENIKIMQWISNRKHIELWFLSRFRSNHNFASVYVTINGESPNNREYQYYAVFEKRNIAEAIVIFKAIYKED